MKPKTFITIISLMIFGMAMLTGFAVIAIMLIGRQAQNPEAAIVNQANETNVTFSNSADFVYFSNNHDKTLVQVNLHDGSSQTVSLGLSETVSDIGGIAFSADGRLAAFCSFERIEETVNNAIIKRTFIVRDLQTGVNLLEISYGNIMACQVAGISPDASTVAVNLVFNSPVENFVGNPNEPDWTLRFFDINSGAMVREMSSDSPFAPNFADYSHAWLDPKLPSVLRILHYASDHIIFVAYPVFGGDGPLDVPAFRWDFNSNSIAEIPNLGEFGSDYLPSTGEIIFLTLDESLPYGEVMGPMPRANTLQISDSTGTRVIYQNAEWLIAQAEFIRGGEAIAIKLLAPFDPNSANPGAETTRIEIITRDGTIQRLEGEYSGMSEIRGTDAGLVFQWSEFMNNPPIFHIENYDGQVIQPIWTFTPSQSNMWLQMVWSPPMNAKSGFAPFAAVN